MINFDAKSLALVLAQISTSAEPTMVAAKMSVVNSVGGFHCACSNPGYRLASDKRHCIGKLCFVTADSL